MVHIMNMWFKGWFLPTMVLCWLAALSHGFDPAQLERVAIHGVQPMTTGGTVGRLIAHPDGRRLLGSSRDGTVRVWDIATGKELQRFQHDNSVFGLALHPDQTRILAGGSDKKLTLWNIDTGEKLRETALKDRVFDVAFSPDGSRFASSDDDETLVVRDTETGEVLETLMAHKRDIYGVRFMSETHIITGGDGGEAVIWDFSEPDKIGTNKFRVGSGDVFSFEGMPDTAWVTTAIEKGHIKIYDPKGDEKWHLEPLGEPRSLSWDAKGERLLLSTTGGELAIYKGTNLLWSIEHQTGKNETWGAEFSTDGKTVFAADGNQVLAFSAVDGSRLDPDVPQRTPGSPRWIRLDEASGNPVILDRAGERTLNLDTGQYGPLTPFPGTYLAYPTGFGLVATSNKGIVTLRSASNGEALGTLNAGRSLKGMVFLSKTKLVLLNTSSELSLWDVSSPKKAAQIWKKKVSGIYKLGPATRDGLRILLATRNNAADSSSALVLLAADTGAELQRLPMDPQYTRAMGRGAGKVLVFVEDSGDKNMTLYGWSTPEPADPLQPEEVDRYIDDLGGDTYRVRTRAVRSLSKGGVREAARLRELLDSDDPEVRIRAGEALEGIAANSRLAPEPLTMACEAELSSLRVHPDGIHWFAVSGIGANAGVVVGRFAGNKLERLRTLQDGHGAARISCSPDGNTLHVANLDGSVTVWAVQD